MNSDSKEVTGDMEMGKCGMSLSMLRDSKVDDTLCHGRSPDMSHVTVLRSQLLPLRTSRNSTIQCRSNNPLSLCQRAEFCKHQ